MGDRGGAVEPLFILRGHLSAVHSVCFHPSGTFLVSGGEDGVLKVWDLKIRRCISSLTITSVDQQQQKRDPKGILKVFFMEMPSSSPLLFTHGRDSIITVWDFIVDDQGSVSMTCRWKFVTLANGFCPFAILPFPQTPLSSVWQPSSLSTRGEETLLTDDFVSQEESLLPGEKKELGIEEIETILQEKSQEGKEKKREGKKGEIEELEERKEEVKGEKEEEKEEEEREGLNVPLIFSKHPIKNDLPSKSLLSELLEQFPKRRDEREKQGRETEIDNRKRGGEEEEKKILLFAAPVGDTDSVALFAPHLDLEDEREEKEEEEEKKTVNHHSLSLFSRLPAPSEDSCGMCMVVRFFVISNSRHGNKPTSSQSEEVQEANDLEDTVETLFVQKQKKNEEQIKEGEAGNGEEELKNEGEEIKRGGEVSSRGPREMLACGFENGQVWFFDLLTSRWVGDIQWGTDPVISLELSNTGKMGAVGTAGTSLLVFKIIERKSTSLIRVECHKEIPNCMSQGGIQSLCTRNRSPSLLLAAGWDHRIWVFGWKSLKQLAILKFHTKSVQSLDVHEEKNLIASGSNDGCIAIWNIY